MKIFLLILLVLLTGCAGMQIEETATHQAIAYASGKGMAIGINELYPQIDPDLTKAWEDMMFQAKDLDMMPVGQLMLFYSDAISIIGLHTNDPYGLVGDLGALLLIFGAQFDDKGEMIDIQPVPMSVMRWFGIGYSNGRRVALRDE
ncbi:MAG: hypothetical protein BBJ57_02330 [Desulfobacterales bacterium PC51MH44]|nr:MAG: hypothetical protein BBJ57_02330 [Desulfobacterales bacterium PC51MH44]